MTEKMYDSLQENIKTVFFRFWKSSKHLTIFILIRQLGKKSLGCAIGWK